MNRTNIKLKNGYFITIQAQLEKLPEGETIDENSTTEAVTDMKKQYGLKGYILDDNRTVIVPSLTCPECSREDVVSYDFGMESAYCMDCDVMVG